MSKNLRTNLWVVEQQSIGGRWWASPLDVAADRKEARKMAAYHRSYGYKVRVRKYVRSEK